MSHHFTLGYRTNIFLLLVLVLVMIFPISSSSQGIASQKLNKPSKISGKQKWKSDQLLQAFLHFDSLYGDVNYSITLCADVPDNNNPARVHLKSETGHVFIILSKWNNKDSINRVFGFYPRRPASSLFFKNVKCEILNNSKREYDISLYKKLDEKEFEMAIQTAVGYAKKKYNISKFNCYDYALSVFNSVAGANPLAVHHIRFPFIFGKGGSPCGLYADLYQMKNNGSAWAPFIQTGLSRAPVSNY